MSWYCDFAPDHPLHAVYHDHEYGFPIDEDRSLFERLCLEIFQAGLSWELILKRQEGLRAAFDNFDIDTVSSYDDKDVARLLADARIIRNRLKVAAVIGNARILRGWRREKGMSFAQWLAEHHPRQKGEWVKLFRKTFSFTGGEIVGEFLMSIGYLPGAHAPECPIFEVIKANDPPWIAAEQNGFHYGDNAKSEAGNK